MIVSYQLVLDRQRIKEKLPGEVKVKSREAAIRLKYVNVHLLRWSVVLHLLFTHSVQKSESTLIGAPRLLPMALRPVYFAQVEMNLCQINAISDASASLPQLEQGLVVLAQLPSHYSSLVHNATRRCDGQLGILLALLVATKRVLEPSLRLEAVTSMHG